MPSSRSGANGTIGRKKLSFNIEQQVGVSLFTAQQLQQLSAVAYFPLQILNDGDTYIALPEAAKQYFSTDERRSPALVVINGSEMPKGVFSFHTNGEAIIWSVANSGFILETTDLLILKI